MASMTLQRLSECTAQNHVAISITGDVSHTFYGDMESLTAPLTDEDKNNFIKVLIRFARIGRTNAQVRTALTNGVTVTI